MKLNFTISGTLPSLNELINANRTNRFGGAALKKKTQAPLELLFRSQARGRKIENHAVCTVKFYEPFNRKHRRDDDNIFAGLKFILDALVNTGIIHDDSPKWLHVIPERIVNTTICMISIELEEDESDQ